MEHAQKPDFLFRRNGRVHLNQQGRQFSRLLAGGVCASAVVMLDTPSSEVVWGVLVTHSIRQFPLHVPSRASPCAITFQLDSTSIQPKLIPIYPNTGIVWPRQGSRKDGKTVTIRTNPVIFLRPYVSYARNDLTDQKTHFISFLIGSYVQIGNITLCRIDEPTRATARTQESWNWDRLLCVCVALCD